MEGSAFTSPNAVVPGSSTGTCLPLVTQPQSMDILRQWMEADAPGSPEHVRGSWVDQRRLVPFRRASDSLTKM
jgi:hypothetical protein